MQWRLFFSCERGCHVDRVKRPSSHTIWRATFYIRYARGFRTFVSLLPIRAPQTLASILCQSPLVSAPSGSPTVKLDTHSPSSRTADLGRHMTYRTISHARGTRGNLTARLLIPPRIPMLKRSTRGAEESLPESAPAPDTPPHGWFDRFQFHALQDALVDPRERQACRDGDAGSSRGSGSSTLAESPPKKPSAPPAFEHEANLPMGGRVGPAERFHEAGSAHTYIFPGLIVAIFTDIVAPDRAPAVRVFTFQFRSSHPSLDDVDSFHAASAGASQPKRHWATHHG